MKSSLLLVLLAQIVVQGTPFTVMYQDLYRSRQLKMVTREEYLRPHFEAPPAPSTPSESTADIDMDRARECTESIGLCPLEEVSAMLNDLQELNEQCSDALHSSSPECSLDARAEQEFLMDELGFQIEQEELQEYEVLNWHPKYSLQERLQRFHEIADYEEH